MQIPMPTQRMKLPFCGVLLQCLDGTQNPIDGAFASGFIRQENDINYLYTCWHVVTGLDPNDVRIAPGTHDRQYLKIAFQGVRREPGMEAIGGNQTAIIPLYDHSITPRKPRWHQDSDHLPHPILNDAGIFVPYWHDLIKLELPSNLTISIIQIIGEDRTVTTANMDIGVGTKCLIVGFPYGFSSAGERQPTPIVLTRFIAGEFHQRIMIKLLESIGSPGMSGGPVFLETAESLLLVGIYTGLIYPGHLGRVREQATAIGTFCDLRLLFRPNSPLQLTDSPSNPITPSF